MGCKAFVMNGEMSFRLITPFLIDPSSPKRVKSPRPIILKDMLLFVRSHRGLPPQYLPNPLKGQFDDVIPDP